MFKLVIHILLIILWTSSSYAKNVLLHGSVAKVEAPSIVLGQDIFIPIDSIAKAYGLKSAWDKDNKTATLSSSQHNFSFLLNSTTVLFDGEAMNMKSPPRIVDGKVVVPAEFGQVQIGTIFKKPVPPHRPLYQKNFLIVIDPGHGDKDFGTMVGNLREKDIVLKTSKELKNFLEKKGFKVKLTRTKDNYITLPNRVAFARQLKADLFISIHVNNAPNKNVHGIEVFYFNDPNKKQNGINYKTNLKRNKYLARLISDSISKNLYVYNRGAKSARYHVIRNATMPAILVELGFLSNAKERQKLASPDVQKMMAAQIANSISFYYHYFKK